MFQRNQFFFIIHIYVRRTTEWPIDCIAFK